MVWTRGSLHILHKHQRNNTDAVDAIIVANQARCWLKIATSTHLHVACRSGASMDVIRHLWIMYPAALAKRNFKVSRTLGRGSNKQSHVQ
jgi:hypothetical protein